MPRHYTIICREGWYYVFVLAFIIGGAMMREINLLMFVAGIMLGPLILGWRLVVRVLQRIDVQRKFPGGIGAGEVFVVDLTASNARRRLGCWGLVVEDRISRLQPADGTRPSRVEVFIPYLAPGQSLETNYEGRLMHRGRYQLGPLVLSTRFPLGLFCRVVELDNLETLYVFPRLGSLTRRWSAAVQPSHIGNQRSQHRVGLLEGEFHSFRDWRSGDPRRWIHWRTTARRNALTVRQFERRQNQDLALLLDLWPERGADCTELVETAIQFGATVTAEQCRRGSSRLLLGIAGRQLDVVSGVTSVGLMHEAMEKLAVADAGHHDLLPALLFQALSDLTRDTRVVIASLRRTDMSDTDRFRSVWQRPGQRQSLGRVVCLQIGSPEFEAVFQPTAADHTTREHRHAR